MPAAEIRDHETGLVSGSFSWFQSRQIFHETHETKANPIFLYFTHFQNYISSIKELIFLKHFLIYVIELILIKTQFKKGNHLLIKICHKNLKYE